MIRNAGKTAAEKAATITNNSKAYLDSITVHITKDNSKTGIWSINTLAGGKEHVYNGAGNSAVITALESATGEKCNGTCTGDCPGCYAKKETRYPDVLINMFENTILARRDPVAFWAMVEKEIYNGALVPAIFRIHDSGDFFSYEYFAACVDMIKRHPETKFGAYTKEKEIVERYGIDNLPENFSLQCSPWPGHCDPIGDLPQFCYDNGSNPELAKLPHCPAVDCHGNRTGVQCVNCRHCYNAKRGQKWAVYAH